LKEKIDNVRKGKKVDYKETDIDLKGGIISENIQYFINDNNDLKKVTKDQFIKFGMDNKFEPKKDTEKGFKMNIENNKVIGYFDSFKK
jgi:hypothetical protein